MKVIDELIADTGVESVSVAFCDLAAGESFCIAPDESYHAASTMKLCVLIELFKRSEQGDLSLQDEVAIRNEFASIVDGSPFSLSEEDDSETSLYSRIGELESLINLAKPMITHSSNLATNLLIDLLGAERITATMRKLGAGGLVVLRGVEDGKAYRLGLNNTATASGLTTLLVGLALGQVVSPEASSQMIDILLAQTHRNCLPALLPPTARIANKTGWNSGICHDCGLIYPDGGAPYALSVLTRGLDEYSTGPELIAEISKLVYEQGRFPSRTRTLG